MGGQLNCLLCETSGLAELVSPTLRDDSSDRFQVVRCLSCGHVQLSPLPSPEEAKAFHQVDSQTRNLMGKVDFDLWQTKTQVDTTRRIEWLQAVLDDRGKVLDVGCGYGFFVDKLIQLGYEAIGVDKNHERLALAKKHLRGTFIEDEIDDSFITTYGNHFQAITLFHVLEHVSAPVKFLKQCASLVTPGGYLLIEIPNLGDELLDQQAEYRAFYWQLAHLSYFDAPRLELALRQAGLDHFTIRGVQRYGVRNLLHWLDERKPQLTASISEETGPLLHRLEELYRTNREHALRSDTLIVEVRV